MAEGSDRRFGVRLPMRLRVEAKVGFRRHDLYTCDVGPEGLFLIMNRPPEPHHLVHLTLELPSDQEKIRLRGFVVRSISQLEAVTGGLTPGVGVHLYGSGDTTRRRWYWFLGLAHREASRIYRTYTPSSGEEEDSPSQGRRPLTPPPGHLWTPLPSGLLTPLPARMHTPLPGGQLTPSSDELTLALDVARLLESSRRVAHHPPRLFQISPTNRAEITRFQLEALSQEGIILRDRPPDEGDRFAVVSVVHPTTSAEFHVPGRIILGRRRYRRSTIIRFVGVTRRTISDFEWFLDHGTPPMVVGDEESPMDQAVIYEDSHETQGEMSQRTPWFERVEDYGAVTNVE